VAFELKGLGCIFVAIINMYLVHVFVILRPPYHVTFLLPQNLCVVQPIKSNCLRARIATVRVEVDHGLATVRWFLTNLV
jgi:hypothetical protein